MKELLEKYVASRKEFRDYEYEVEKSFGELLESIPRWQEILGSVIISNGYNVPEDFDFDSLEEVLIPEVKDLEFCGGDRVSFKIRIPSDTWVKRWIEVGWFPLEWLTNPETKPVNADYIKGKIMRRRAGLERLMKEKEGIDSDITKTTEEIERLKKLLEKD